MPKRSRFAALSVNKPQRILTCNHGGRYGVPSCLQPTVVCKSRLWLQRLLNLVPTPSIKQYRTNNHITSASVSVQPCLVVIFRYKMWGILSSLLLHSISVFSPTQLSFQYAHVMPCNPGFNQGFATETLSGYVACWIWDVNMVPCQLQNSVLVQYNSFLQVTVHRIN